VSRASIRAASAVVFLVLLVATSAPAQEMANPADKHRRGGGSGAADSVIAEAAATRVYEMPVVEVQGKRVSHLVEEGRVGAYAQPRWTAHRRFGQTRVYVMPGGVMEFEYWLLPTFSDHGIEQTTVQYEAGFGLPHRFQLDLYSLSHKEGREGPTAMDGQKVEVRWALADWNVIPANPTLYLEWIGVSGAYDHVEGKLLLGGELVPRWHWGTNLVFEHEMGGPQENSNELTGGVSYTLADAACSIGAETKLAVVDVRASRGDYTREFQVGPSFQCNPLRRMHVDLVPLFGVSHGAPKVALTAVLGWEL
jgi:hypothetical protein